ncbi:TIGR00341 family protein [Thalassovita aquimarina]|uniref:TIGR00341 family protein n=1 Tax=Thalassovita aquimarina TaxID=2785917 RepID=UPI001BB0093E|nr:TIGR00341 family protein [Thalassovita aquimarina]
MALRLIELVLHEEDSADLRALLKDYNVLEHRQIRLENEEVLVRILLDSEQSEPVLDLLEKRYTGKEGNRVVVVPIEATLPRAPVEPEPESAAPSEKLPPGEEPPKEKTPERIGREELYEDIKSGARLSRVYLAMVALSTVVAAIGLYNNNVTVVIGAMVIAPLLAPNVALSLGITLGDLSLLRQGMLTALAGIAAALVLSVLIGVLLDVDPTLSEMASRTRVGLGDIVLALASGCAGALAFTAGVSATLIGVMVAVALLPPLVTSGLLLGGGHPSLATGAFLLFLVNLICVNLAGMTTFLVQGIKPTNWWEKDRAVKATRISIVLSVVLLAILVGMIVLTRRG